MTPVLELRELTIGVRETAAAPIVDRVSLAIEAGQTVGLVGESGSGKSLTCLAAMGLLPAALRVDGQVLLAGVDVGTADARELRQLRGSAAAMIFQEPMSSLNPTLPVGAQLAEAIRHRDRDANRRTVRARAIELLDQVGLAQQEQRLRQYPHQLSGGMCQRVMIAIALGGRPQLLIADEPTTALDVTIQAQILHLLSELVDELAMSLLLVTHDLGVVAQSCEQTLVMYGGRVVESGPTSTVLNHPEHPYTAALLRSLPSVDGPLQQLNPIPGSVPAADAMPPGCRFHPRCPDVADRCGVEVPPLGPVAPEHEIACWVHGSIR